MYRFRTYLVSIFCLIILIHVGGIVSYINDHSCVDQTTDCQNPEALRTICRSSVSSGFCRRSCHLCPIDGEWGKWQSWYACSKTCGIGRQIRQRKCDNPAPSSNGAYCLGSGVITRACNITSCPPDCSSLKADIVFLVDASGSMSTQSFTRELAFVEDVIHSLPIGSQAVQVGFLAFSTNVYNVIYLNQYGNRNSLIAAIKQVRYSGGQTYTSKALSVANTMVFTAVHGDRNDANNIIILLTDGISNTPRDTSHEVQLLRSRGIEMMVVAIGNNPGSEARTISSSFGDLFTLSNFQGLNKSLTERLLDTMCDEVTPCGEWGAWSQCSASCGQGFRTRHKICRTKRYLFQRPIPQTTSAYLPLIPLQASSTANSTEIQHSPCNAEHNCSDCSSLEVDIVFVVDASGSMSAQSFNRELAFVEDVIQRLPIGSQAVQVGFLAFSTNVYNTIYLNQYGDRKSLIAAIKQVRYSGGQTYTSKALSVANTMVFTAVHGDRDDANNIIILLTDGISSTPRDTSHEVQFLRSRGIEMMVVAIGNNPRSEAQTISSSSGDLFTVSNFQGLNKSLTEGLLYTLCDDITPCGEWGAWSQCSVSCGQGFRTRHKICRTKRFLFQRPIPHTTSAYLPLIPLQASSTANSTEIQHSSCNSGHNCSASQQCQDVKADIIFILDSSSAVTSANFKVEKQFVNKIIDKFTIGKIYTQVAVGVYSTRFNYFRLNSYTDKNTIKSHTLALPYLGGNMETYITLNSLRNMLSRHQFGDRRDAPNAVVIITNGKSGQASSASYQASLLRSMGLKIISVGIGHSHVDEQSKIASSKDSIYTVSDVTKLDMTLVNRITKSICADFHQTHA